jgi:hypothetical protein
MAVVPRCRGAIRCAAGTLRYVSESRKRQRSQPIGDDYSRVFVRAEKGRPDCSGRPFILDRVDDQAE